jgi:hypothetical protein
VRFVPTEEQADFVRTLDQLLAGADTVAAATACWTSGRSVTARNAAAST